jgi:hypothetical protein
VRWLSGSAQLSSEASIDFTKDEFLRDGEAEVRRAMHGDAEAPLRAPAVASGSKNPAKIGCDF